MIQRRVGRNDPCPCGSDKKYKKCCGKSSEQSEGPLGGAESISERPPEIQKIFDGIREAQHGREFRSIEEEQEFMNRLLIAQSVREIDDFDGLSPDQMRRFLHFPFESPQFVELPEEVEIEPRGPLSELFRCIVEAIDDKGLKLTPKGNLPRAVSREAARQVLGEEGYARFTEFSKLSSEEDYQDLFVSRVVAQQAGLLRKRHGRLYRTERCKNLMEIGSLRRIYPRLLSTFAKRFNWAYRDGYPELRIVQQSFLFTLRLLHRHGTEWRDATFYETAFLQAFPGEVSEDPGDDYSTPEERLAGCYRVRALERFAGFCGLVEVDPDPVLYHIRDRRVRSRPLLYAAVKFKV